MKPVNTDVHFPTVEEQIFAFWKKNSLMEKGLKANEGKEPFVFYDGPPFATGLPHYGHLLAGTIKVSINSYLLECIFKSQCIGYCDSPCACFWISCFTSIRLGYPWSASGT